MYTKEEIVEKVQGIAEGMDAKAQRVEELKASILIDRGRLEELKNLHNLIVEAEAEKPKPKRKSKPSKKAS